MTTESRQPQPERKVSRAEQIAEVLRGSIERGDVKRGVRLGTVADLSKAFGDPQITIRRALKQINHLVESRRGRSVGVYVRTEPLVLPERPKPPHEQIADQLKTEIEAGTIASGNKFPTEAELMARFDIGPRGVRRVITILRTEKLVYKKGGEGNYVTDPSMRETAQAVVIYHSIADRILSDIFNRDIWGENLLSDKDLAQQYEVSRKVILKATNLLQNAGFIEKIQGSGKRVLPGSEKEIEQRLANFQRQKEQTKKRTKPTEIYNKNSSK